MSKPSKDSSFVKCVPYEYFKIDLVWVCNYYDIPLSGICHNNGKLCRFETDYDTLEVSIYSLTTSEKVKLKIRQKLFEWFVGYHWTYPYRKQGHRFYYRWPKWFWKLVFRVYYSIHL